MEIDELVERIKWYWHNWETNAPKSGENNIFYYSTEAEMTANLVLPLLKIAEIDYKQISLEYIGENDQETSGNQKRSDLVIFDDKERKTILGFIEVKKPDQLDFPKAFEQLQEYSTIYNRRKNITMAPNAWAILTDGNCYWKYKAHDIQPKAISELYDRFYATLDPENLNLSDNNLNFNKSLDKSRIIKFFSECVSENKLTLCEFS